VDMKNKERRGLLNVNVLLRVSRSLRYTVRNRLWAQVANNMRGVLDNWEGLRKSTNRYTRQTETMSTTPSCPSTFTALCSPTSTTGRDIEVAVLLNSCMLVTQDGCRNTSRESL